jgi:hypothetical protein
VPAWGKVHMSAGQRTSALDGGVLGEVHFQRASATFLFVCGALLAAPAGAHQSDSQSDVPGSSRDDPRSTHASADPALFLPGAVAAASGSHRVVGVGWGGFDAATHDPLLGATVEAVLGSRLAIGAGVTYAAATNSQPAAARPTVVVRLQILDQRRHGLDAGVAVGYGQERFAEEQGLFRGSLAGGWRSDHATLLANLTYGQDGEGDDHEGDIRLAGLYRVGRNLHLGLDGRVWKLLDSTDPNLAQHGTPSLEFTAGPVAALTTRSWALLVATGVSGVRRGTLQTGPIVLGSVGAVF